MITVKTNISSVTQVIIKKLQSLEHNDVMLRTCATTVLGMMKNRIHEQGKDANGNQIGTYSAAYMKIRTGNYLNSATFSRGKNKGKLKNAGVFSKGATKSAARPQYHRSNDTKVVLSLTRQMENDMKVIALGNGFYGIGYSNTLNYQKSQWVERTYRKEGQIFAMDAEEQKAVTEIVNQFTQNALSE